MSKVFRSTRGAASVGFMGIGLKSVFKRFRTLMVSGWGWAFRFHVEMVEGSEFRDKQPDLIGAVLPVWDDTISSPDTGFTTRFELANPLDSTRTTAVDLEHLVTDDGSVLAALAWRGLRELRLTHRTWRLDQTKVFDTEVIIAQSEDKSLRWCLFSHRYVPSREAIARFLEIRRLRPEEGDEQAFNEAVSREREVVGILPLDENGRPSAPPAGRVYATLPTQATLPFRLHLNADWLLSISRTGLRELEDNAWQREIVAGAAHVVAQFLRWLTTNHADPDTLAAGYSILTPPAPENTTTLSRSFNRDAWRSLLAGLLRDSPVIPAWVGGTLTTRRPGAVVVLPEELTQVFAAHIERRPDLLFGGPVLASPILGSTGKAFFEWLSLLRTLAPGDAAAAMRVRITDWWAALPREDLARHDVLFEVWAALSQLEQADATWAYLPCVPTDAGGWTAASEVMFLDSAPSADEELGAEVLAFLDPGLPPTDRRIPDQLLRLLRAGSSQSRTPFRRNAQNWLEAHARRVELRDVVATVIEGVAACQPLPVEALIHMTQWARRHNRPDLLTQVVVVRLDGGNAIVPIKEALVAEPYVSDPVPRRALYPLCPKVSPAHVETDPFAGDVGEWRTFFEQRDARGPLRITPFTNKVGRYERAVAREFVGTDDIPEANWSGYELTDFRFDPPIGEPQVTVLAGLLTERTAALRDCCLRKLSSYYYTLYHRKGPNPAAWVRDLLALRWVPDHDGQFHTVDEVLLQPADRREDGPVAAIPETLGKILTDAGITFGRNIGTLPAVRRLARLGNKLSGPELGSLIREACSQIGEDKEELERLKQVLTCLTVPRANDGTRVPLHRVVKGRGGLGGWVVSVEDLDSALREAFQVAEFPIRLETGPTGLHAIEFLEDSWRRAEADETGLANRVRQILPAAYATVLRDLEDANVATRWCEARNRAWVFADREWMAVASEPKPAYDDLHDPLLSRLLPSLPPLVTAGHLGETEEQRRKIAEELGLCRLSAELHVSINSAPTFSAPEWAARFEWLQDLLEAVRADEDVEQLQRLTLVPTTKIELTVNGTAHDVNVYLDGRRILVAGNPGSFDDDVATALVHHFRLGRRGDIAARLATLVAALGEDAAFQRKARNFLTVFKVELTPPWLNATGREATPPETPPEQEPAIAEGRKPVRKDQEESAAATRSKSPKVNAEPQDSVDGQLNESEFTKSDGQQAPAPAGKPSNTLQRENARLQATIAKLLKGEIGAPPHPVAAEVGPKGKGAKDDEEELEIGDESLGDETYRQAVIEYERRRGRTGEVGAGKQPGWDLRSTDGSKTRFIEVKGKGLEWTGDEIVSVSRAQAREAMRQRDEIAGTSWWLYVVEKIGPRRYRVLPIENPVTRAAGWMLRGDLWRQAVTDAEEVELNEAA